MHGVEALNASEFGGLDERALGLTTMGFELSYHGVGHCDREPAGIVKSLGCAIRALGAEESGHVPALLFFTDETSSKFLESLISGLKAAGIAKEVHHGDALVSAALPRALADDNYIAYEASMAVRAPRSRRPPPDLHLPPPAPARFPNM